MWCQAVSQPSRNPAVPPTRGLAICHYWDVANSVWRAARDRTVPYRVWTSHRGVAVTLTGDDRHPGEAASLLIGIRRTSS